MAAQEAPTGGVAHRSGRQTFQPFPLDALPGRLRSFVAAVAAATGTDPSFAALAALVVVAGCVGNRVAVLIKSGWSEPAVLWGALVGRSGVATKSPVLKLVTRPVYEIYKRQRQDFEAALCEYERELQHYAVRHDEWKRAQRNGKGPPTDPPEAPQRPREPRVLVSDITIEKLGCLLEENPLGLLLVRDELAAWIGAFDRYSPGGKGSDQPAWLSMYDAAAITIDRKGAARTMFVEHAAVSVLGSIQPGTLARVFGAAEREAGLLARVLLVYPPEKPALWTDAELSDDAAVKWHDLICGLLELKPSEDDLGNPRPRIIPIGRDAKPLWVEWQNRHVCETDALRSDDLAAHFGKLKGACARVALLFTCIEVVAGGGNAASVGADAMRQAIAVVEWFKGEARRVYGTLADAAEDRERRRLTDWIERRGGSVSVNELTHGMREYRAKPGPAQAALDALAAAGEGEWRTPASGPKGGRPSPRFHLLGPVTVTETPVGAIGSRGLGDGDTVSDSDGERPPAENWLDCPEAHGIESDNCNGAP